MLALSLLFFNTQDFSWGWFAILFLAPDLGLLGYLINPKAGAIVYNIAHHKGVAIIIYLAGIYFSVPQLQFIGILLFAHSSFDRIFGYGLKYYDSFHHTHLGMIGKEKTDEK
jgi:hypothetical protein